MALRVVRVSATAATKRTSTAASVGSLRCFSDAKKDEEAAEDALMEQLKNQAFEDAERTILPFHASERANITIDNTPIPYPSEVSIVSGDEQFSAGRKVHIFKPARHQMQSGTYNTKHWEIRFDSPRTWQNPLMGWTSTADPFHAVVMKFDTKQEALDFAEKQRWIVDVEEPAETGNFDGKISYSHNFLPLHIENLIKKEGKKSSVQFRHPTGRRSNWVKTLKYHGDGVVAQHGGEAKE